MLTQRRSFRKLLQIGCVLSLMLLFTAQLPAAGVYKWVDENGKVHFTDKPPSDVKTESIKINTRRDEHTAERLKQFSEQADQSATQRKQARTTAAAEKAEREAAKKQCQAARDSLQNLLNSTRRQTIGEDGQRQFLDEEKRQEWIKTAREEIEKNC